MTVKKYELQEVKDILPLKDAWAKLENGAEMTTFQTHEWHRLLLKEWYGWKLHALYSRIIIYIAYDQDEPVMIFPAIIYKFSTKTKWFGQPKGVYLMGQGSYSDYMNAIYSVFSSEAFESIMAEIRKDFPKFSIFLNAMREDSSCTKYLIENKKSVPQEDTVSVAVKKNNTVEDYEATLSKNTKQNLRTALNRLKKDNIEYQMTVVGKIEDSHTLQILQQIHIKRMKIKNQNHGDFIHKVSSVIRIAVRSYREKYNSIVLMSMKENDHSCTVLIKLNGQIAGYLYGLKEKHAIRVIYNCFDEKYKFYSPMFRGSYDYIIDSYKNPSIHEIDFTRGDEAYKYKLGGTETMLYCFQL